MITRDLKLKLNKTQEQTLEQWLWYLTGVYNWASRKIELDAQDKIYHSKFDLAKSLSGVSKVIKVPAQVIQQTAFQAYTAWDRTFKKLAKKPHLKGQKNKLRSFCFPQHIKLNQHRIQLPMLGKLRYFKQEIPEGKIKQARIIRRVSGWYCQLVIDAKHTFPVKDTEEKVGIDTGFKHLAILSNGQKFSNRREFVKGQKRLAQAQRGGRKKLVARLHERISNRRKDYNHKVSRQIVENFKEIYITNDNLRGQAKIFGKSVSDAGINQLRQFILYKSANHDRKCVLVDSKNTTLLCSNCGAKTGPTGLGGLNVRTWECSNCGLQNDRDINSAKVILKSGLGHNLGVLESHEL